jgi:hypothetical protein
VFKTVGKKPIKDCQFLFGAYTCVTDSNSSNYADRQYSEPINKRLKAPTERLYPSRHCSQLLINLCRSLSINLTRRINRGPKVGSDLPAPAPDRARGDAASVRARWPRAPPLGPIKASGRRDTPVRRGAPLGRDPSNPRAAKPKLLRDRVVLRGRRWGGRLALVEIKPGSALDLGRTGEIDRGCSTVFERNRQ